MLLVTSDFFHHVGCDIILVCVFLFQLHFFSFDYCFFYFYLNESVCITTGENLVTCMEVAMRNILHVFIALLWFGCAFPVLLFNENPEKLWILFSDTVLSTRVVNISPAQRTICFVVSQQIKKFFSSIWLCLWFVSSKKWTFKRRDATRRHTFGGAVRRLDALTSR